jgi:hypothetical protein
MNMRVALEINMNLDKRILLDEQQSNRLWELGIELEADNALLLEPSFRELGELLKIFDINEKNLISVKISTP